MPGVIRPFLAFLTSQEASTSFPEGSGTGSRAGGRPHCPGQHQPGLSTQGDGWGHGVESRSCLRTRTTGGRSEMVQGWMHGGSYAWLEGYDPQP